MTLKTPSHLTVGGKPFCDWLGCPAGRDIAAKAGVRTCSQPSIADAAAAARALQPFFCVPVKAVRGDCTAA